MKKQVSKNEAVLKTIRREFTKEARHRTHRALPYSERLKDLILTAVSDGQSVALVAQAAAISISCVRAWSRVSVLNEVPQPKAIELKFDPLLETPMARVRLRSGACLEFPVSALTASLFGALNTGDLG